MLLTAGHPASELGVGSQDEVALADGAGGDGGVVEAGTVLGPGVDQDPRLKPSPTPAPTPAPMRTRNNTTTNDSSTSLESPQRGFLETRAWRSFSASSLSCHDSNVDMGRKLAHGAFFSSRMAVSQPRSTCRAGDGESSR